MGNLASAGNTLQNRDRKKRAVTCKSDRSMKGQTARLLMRAALSVPAIKSGQFTHDRRAHGAFLKHLYMRAPAK
jgi:hypothetical protein